MNGEMFLPAKFVKGKNCIVDSKPNVFPLITAVLWFSFWQSCRTDIFSEKTRGAQKAQKKTNKALKHRMQKWDSSSEMSVHSGGFHNWIRRPDFCYCAEAISVAVVVVSSWRVHQIEILWALPPPVPLSNGTSPSHNRVMIFFHFLQIMAPEHFMWATVTPRRNLPNAG